MRRFLPAALACSTLILSATALAGQEVQQATISLYRVAPGKHLDFLKWQAEREAIAREAGAAPTRWYAHMSGDSWDFISIAELPDAERQAGEDQKIEELTKKKGMTTGFAAGLEFRQFVNWHSDTEAAGPFTAAELVQEASSP